MADATDLNQVEPFRDHLGVVCRSGHPLASQAVVRWRDVSHYPHIVLHRSSLWQLIDAQFPNRGAGLLPAFEVAHVGTMIGLIASDLGIGAMPESFRQNIDMTGLIYRRINNKAAYRTNCMTTAKDRSTSPLTGVFLQHCQLLATEIMRERMEGGPHHHALAVRGHTPRPRKKRPRTVTAG